MVEYGCDTSQNDSSEREFRHIEKVPAKFLLSDFLVFLFFFCYYSIVHVDEMLFHLYQLDIEDEGGIGRD